MTDESRAKDKYIVRLPDGLRDEIKEAAKANGRSMNAEIVARLQGSVKTLRDEFAMFALAGFLAGDAGMQRPVEDAAGWSYAYADAMLAARQQQGGGND